MLILPQPPSPEQSTAPCSIRTCRAGSPALLDLSFWEKSLCPEKEFPARAAFAADSAAALLVLESRSGITGGVSTVAMFRYDAALPVSAVRQLTPFSVPWPQVSMPTFGPGYLTRCVRRVPHSGHPPRDHLCAISRKFGTDSNTYAPIVRWKSRKARCFLLSRCSTNVATSRPER